jgi:hypothetical protein
MVFWWFGNEKILSKLEGYRTTNGLNPDQEMLLSDKCFLFFKYVWPGPYFFISLLKSFYMCLKSFAYEYEEFESI